MRWWRLDYPAEVDLEKVRDIVEGVEIESEERTVYVTVKRGTAFCGRPVHVWEITLRGRYVDDGRAVLTHWIVEERHTTSISTLGFATFFPEAVRPFKTPHAERRRMANEAARELEKVSRAVRVKTRFGDIWDVHLEEIKEWLDRGIPVWFYECRECGRAAFTTTARGRCTACGSPVEPVEVTPEDLQ